MGKRIQQRSTAAGKRQTAPPGWVDPLAPKQPLVSVRWLITALAVSILLAAGAGYLTLALLFYQGQWQMLYHPSAAITATPAIPFDEIRFDYTETGRALLSGWWVPAGSPAQKTVLLLHEGTGSLSNTVQKIESLHALGVNVFAFDYRGFGRSEPQHPTERTILDDAGAAWNYLTTTRHLAPSSVVFYGVGIGATIAAESAAAHPEAAALVMEAPGPDAMARYARDARTLLLPMRMLASDRLDPRRPLAHCRLPKLFLPGADADGRTGELYAAAAEPKRLGGSLKEFLAALPGR